MTGAMHQFSMSACRFGGKVVESWEHFDTAGLMMQLGTMPMGTGG